MNFLGYENPREHTYVSSMEKEELFELLEKKSDERGLLSFLEKGLCGNILMEYLKSWKNTISGLPNIDYDKDIDLTIGIPKGLSLAE